MGCKCVDEYDNEDVRKLIERPEKPAVKSPRYRSRHASRTIREIARAKSAHATLGQPRVPLKPPSAYLRKGEGPRPRRSKSSHKHYRPPDYARQLPDWKPAKRPARGAPGDLPDLPRDPREDRRSAGQLDFCKRNVEGVVKYRNAKVQSIKFCDTRHGDRQELRPSGLQLTYVHKKNYGRVPQFVKTSRDDRKRSAAAAATASQRDRSRASLPTGCVYLTEDQRARLLESMKVKRASLMKTFQCLPFVIDTAPKIKRKAALEDKLKQVEKDIELFESHPYIFVYNE